MDASVVAYINNLTEMVFVQTLTIRDQSDAMMRGAAMMRATAELVRAQDELIRTLRNEIDELRP